MLAATIIVPLYSDPEENGVRIATMIAIALLVLVPLSWRALRRRRDRRDHAFFVAAVANRALRPLDPTWSVPDRPPREMALAAQDNDHIVAVAARTHEVRPLFVGVVGRIGSRGGTRPLDLVPDPRSIYPLSRPRQEANWD